MAGIPIARAPRAISAVALGLVLIFVSVACAAMVPAASAPAHPCCPKSGQAGPDRCEKTGCVSAVPVLPAASIDRGTDVPAVVQTEFMPAIESPAPGLTVTGFPSLTPEPFLKLHQLLI
jgi:hypothetical protein